MALNAKNKKHGEQIAAGIKGRNKGHNFERDLTASLNKINPKLFLKNKEINEHIFLGRPENILFDYVLNREGFAPFTGKFKAYWLGGLATSGQGDMIPGLDGENLKRAKADVLLEFEGTKKNRHIGVSIKTCNKEKPTNAQLFCSTATAFCELLRRNNIEVSNNIELGLKMFCGDSGYSPKDQKKDKGRLSDPDRWFYEELPEAARKDMEMLFTKNQDEITKVLLTKGYSDDPFPPEYVFHQMHKAESPTQFPVAIFSMDELLALSKSYRGYELRPYLIRKGRFKGDPNTHFAPRFGCVQFQRLGNKQNATQLQFNLEANYFNKITKSNT